MVNLLKAGLYKEFKRKSIYLYMLLIILVSVLCLILINKNYKNNELNIKVNFFSKEEYKKVFKYGDYSNYIETYKEYSDIFDNYVDKGRYAYLMNYIYEFMFAIGVVIILISYNNISYDYQKNTIRYIYLSKYSRKTVYISRLLTVFIISIVFSIILFLSMLITTSLLTGSFNSNVIISLLLTMIINLIPIWFIINLIMMLFLLFNSSISLIITIIIYLSSLLITQLCLDYNIIFIKYLFFPYMDYSIFKNMIDVSYFNMIFNLNYSYLFNSIILILYSILFIFISFKLIKKDC